MSFVFSSLGCRLTVAVFSALTVAGCSGSERIPLAEIGGGPRAGDQLIGKVDRTRDGRVLVGRIGDPRAEAAAYAPAPTAQNAGSAGIDYLDTPNLAGTSAVQAAPLSAAAEASAVDEGESATEGAATAMAIPEGGVNIDGELGIGTSATVSDAGYADGTSPVGVQPQLVTRNGAMAIAEGNTSQPVVDGIGFDEPTQIVTGPSGQQPVVQETQVAEQMPEEGGILPLSVDSGSSGMDDQGVLDTRRSAAAASPVRAPAGKDCSLYLDKRNCR